MDKYIKYIFFFVLGIILHLFLKKDMVEGYLDVANILTTFTANNEAEGYLTSGDLNNLVISKASNIEADYLKISGLNCAGGTSVGQNGFYALPLLEDCAEGKYLTGGSHSIPNDNFRTFEYVGPHDGNQRCKVFDNGGVNGTDLITGACLPAPLDYQMYTKCPETGPSGFKLETFGPPDNLKKILKCEACPAGNISNGSGICTQCPPGSYANSDGTTCRQCPEGYGNEINLAECNPCLYPDISTGGVCSECHNGKGIRGNECIICEVNGVNNKCYSDYEIITNVLSDPTTDPAIPTYDKRDFKCSVNRTVDNCEGVSTGWDINDIRTNYISQGVDKTLDTYTLNSCDKYDKLCFNSSGTNSVTNVEQCKSKCDTIGRCLSFSFSDEGGTGPDKCCLYTNGYKGYSHGAAEGFNCYTKKNCPSDSIITNGACMCNIGDDTKSCLNYDICGTDLSVASDNINSSVDADKCFKLNNIPRGIYDKLVNERKFCKTTRDGDNAIGEYCACLEIPTGSPDNYSDYICNASSICNADSFNQNNFGCHSFITNEINNENTSCNYNEISGSTGKRDSDILGEVCHCNVRVSGNTNLFEESCNSEGTNLKYCKIRDNTCSILEDCVNSDILLDESCKYTGQGGETMMCNYLNEDGVKDKIFNNLSPEKCISLSNCPMDTELEGHCFCPNPNMTGVSNICLPDHICSSASGCLEKQACQDNYTYNSNLNKCVPPNCIPYSESNPSPITSECVCTSDPSYNENSGSGVCNPGYYCLPRSTDTPGNIPYYGCQTVEHLKPRCPIMSSGNTDAISEECFCNTSGVNILCSKGEHCTIDGCSNITCGPDEIIKLVDNEILCINKNHEELGLFDDFNLNDFLKKLKKINLN